MSAHTPAPRPEGHAVVGILYGLLFTAIILGVILLPAVFLAIGLWWIDVLLAIVLWLILLRHHLWRR